MCFLTFRDWIIWPNTRICLPKNAVLFGHTPHARLWFPTKIRVSCLLCLSSLFVFFVCLICFFIWGAIAICNTIGWLYCQRTLTTLLASVLLVAFSWTSLPLTTGEKKSIAQRSPAAHFFSSFFPNFQSSWILHLYLQWNGMVIIKHNLIMVMVKNLAKISVNRSIMVSTRPSQTLTICQWCLLQKDRYRHHPLVICSLMCPCQEAKRTMGMRAMTCLQGSYKLPHRLISIHGRSIMGGRQKAMQGKKKFVPSSLRPTTNHGTICWFWQWFWS